MITRAVFSAAITLGATLALAAPVGADLGSFGTLGCSCMQPLDVPHATPADTDQVNQGIRSGLDALHGGTPDPGDF